MMLLFFCLSNHSSGAIPPMSMSDNAVFRHYISYLSEPCWYLDLSVVDRLLLASVSLFMLDVQSRTMTLHFFVSDLASNKIFNSFNLAYIGRSIVLPFLFDRARRRVCQSSYRDRFRCRDTIVMLQSLCCTVLEHQAATSTSIERL